MGFEAKKKRQELEFMLASQARFARIMAGQEPVVPVRNAFEQMVEDMSLVDKGLIQKAPDFASAYEDKGYPLS